MRKFLLAAAAALFATQSAAPDAASAQAPRRHLGRPILGQPVRRISPAIHRRPRAARERDGVPQRLSEPCRDRDLPGPFDMLTGDHPARTGIIANTWIDQSVGRVRHQRLLRRGRERPRHQLDRLQGLAQASAGADARRADEGAMAGQPHRRRRRQGPRGDHDGRAHADQRWYWTGTKFDTDLAGARGPGVVPKVNAARRRRARAAAAAARADALLPVQGARRADRGWRQAGRQRAASRARPATWRLPRLARARRRYAGACRRPGRRNASSAAAPAPDLLAISLSATDYVGHAYGTEGEEMCLQLTELDRELGDFLKILDSRGIDYAVVLTADHGGKDVPERERLAGVPDAARVERRPRSGDDGQGAGRQARPQRSRVCSAPAPQGDIYLDAHLKPADRARLLAAAVAAYKADPQVEAVFTASADRRARPCRPATRWTGACSSARGPASIPAALATSSSSSRRTSRRSPTPATALWRPTARPRTMTAACRSCSGGPGKWRDDRAAGRDHRYHADASPR